MATTRGLSSSAASASSVSGLCEKTTIQRSPASFESRAQPGDLRGADARLAGAVAVDGVEHDRPDVGAEVGRVVHVRVAEPALGLAGRVEPAGRVGGDLDRVERDRCRRAGPRRRPWRSTSSRGGSRSGSSEGTSRSPVANASISGVTGTSPWASTSWLPTSGYQGALRPGGLERLLRGGERAGVGGRVVVGAVVEGVGGVGRLHAVVALGAAVGIDRLAVERRRAPCVSSLRCALSVMSPVTKTACGCSRLSARTAASSICVENASCGPERRRERRARAIEERHARGRLLVADVRVGELREGGERAAELRGLAAVAQRLARARPRGTRRRRGRRGCAVERRAGRARRTRRARVAAAGGDASGARRARASTSARRITPPSGPRRSARAARVARPARWR